MSVWRAFKGRVEVTRGNVNRPSGEGLLDFLPRGHGQRAGRRVRGAELARVQPGELARGHLARM